MASTPSRQGNPSLPPTPSTQGQGRRSFGEFKDGEWWCNCDPNRQKAKTWPVTDRSKATYGKYFLKCASSRCKFWLWESEAMARAPSYQPNHQPPGSTQPPVTQFFTPATAERHANAEEAAIRGSPPSPTPARNQASDQAVFTSSDSSEGIANISAETAQVNLNLGSPPQTPNSKRTSKRKRVIPRRSQSGNDSDGFEGDDLTPSEMEEAIHATEKTLHELASKKRQFQRQEERRRRRQQQQQQPYPASTATSRLDDVARILFPTPTAPRGVSFRDTPELFEYSLSVTDSAASSATLAADMAGPSSPLSVNGDATQEVMDLLAGAKIDEKTLAKVREVLERAARSNRGAVLRMESARAALKEKDGKIARMERRLTEQRLTLDEIRANLMQLDDDE